MPHSRPTLMTESWYIMCSRIGCRGGEHQGCGDLFASVTNKQRVNPFRFGRMQEISETAISTPPSPKIPPRPSSSMSASSSASTSTSVPPPPAGAPKAQAWKHLVAGGSVFSMHLPQTPLISLLDFLQTRRDGWCYCDCSSGRRQNATPVVCFQ